ncbi:MAG TPA: molybdopterin cofactor-binding domain-containing protein [Streptosporangiaceae bacterium]|nr:molybdopterin cofactor-binding domain-containing protein [Streptosporangiaceae bacterium]
MALEIIVNDVPREVADDDSTLLSALRDQLGVTGPKFGCGEGECRACTVLIGRRAVPACQTPVREAAGQRVTTVEGLAQDGILHPVQQAWLECGATQCGYCTPGWLTATAALLARVPHPTDERIAAELTNVCRCCTYPRIRRAVHRAAELMEDPEHLEPVPDVVKSGTDADDHFVANAPWDLARERPESFAASIPEGLLAVVTSDGQAEAGRPPTGPSDAWVHVGADGAVTAFTGKVECGQGTRTALAMLVAEELAVPVGSVSIAMGDTSTSPFDLGTFGSRAMPYATPPLRAAAAGARRLLTEAAADRFGLTPDRLTAAGGLIAGPDGAPSVSYADLVSGQRRVEQVAADTAVSRAADWRVAGHAAATPGAAAVVTGAKRFPADLARPGMRHGAVLRPPSHGAELISADTAAASAVPGVTVVRDGSFVGVVAPDSSTAALARDKIQARWSPPAWDVPEPVTPASLESWLRSHPKDGEGLFGRSQQDRGDVDEALRAGPVRLDAQYSAAFIAHVPMEPRSALAQWRDDGGVTVWTGTSTPFRARGELAAALGLAQDQVQVVVPDYGGGFGGKHGSVVALEAARLARATGAPVRVQWTRPEEFQGSYLRPAAVIDVSSAAGADGQLTGFAFTNINSGAVGIAPPYRIPSWRLTFQPAVSPLAQGSYRALAATANNFARESHLDELAAAVGADPVEYRLRHLDDERLAAVLRAAAEHIGWGTGLADAGLDDAGLDDAGAEAGDEAAGIALGMEKGGRVATAARVRVGADGRLTVLRLVTAVDCGAVVHPDGLLNQVEGAVMMALGGALFEAIDFQGGRILNASLERYRVPRLTDLPEVEVVLLDRPDQPSAGGGETPMIAVAPAIGNAVFRACGVRLRSLPLAPRGVVPRPADS